MEIVRRGGIDAILKALVNHGGAAAVQLQECRALQHADLSQKDGVIELVQQAMSGTNATANTKKFGQHLLEKLRPACLPFTTGLDDS